MPRNVRNFWIEIEVDGKATKIAVGPKSKDGGFSMKILMRENGDISSKQVKIEGFVNLSGELVLVAGQDGEKISLTTKR